jgi:PAS domain S-box-containing protein
MTREPAGTLGGGNRHVATGAAPRAASGSEALERLTRLAARLLGAPVALFWPAGEGEGRPHPGAVGIEARWLERWDAPNTRDICRYVIRTGEPLLIGDLHGAEGGKPAGAPPRAVAYACTPLRSPHGTPIGALCVIDARPRRWSEADLTALGELAATAVAEIELREGFGDRKHSLAERLRLAAIIEATPDLALVADPEGEIAYLNRGGRKILGIPEGSDLTWARISSFFPAWAYDLLAREWIPKAIRDGAWSGELTLLARDGREVPVSLVIIAHRGEEGAVTCLSMLARDLTAHKRLEAQIRQSLKLDAVGRLAGGVAHDFNNLLTAIRGHTELLLEDLAPADPLRADLEEIRRSAERAALLTRQLLAFSRKQVLQPRLLDLRQSLPTMAGVLRRRLGEANDLLIEFAPDLGRVKVDPDQLEAVLSSLVHNARDAMPAGGVVRITASNATLDDGFSRRFPYRVQPGPYVLLTVQDEGIGMDEVTQERIFEPFFTTKEPGKGTGLGLSTVYGIVKQSGGYIWADSAVGRGATMQIYLPRVEEGEVVPPAALGAEGGEARTAETILLVEDEDAVRSLARRILERRGYTVLEARHGMEALQVAESFTSTIHLLLTDLTMPEMNGRVLAERLAVLRPGMRVLFMSGYTEDDIFRRGALEAGAAFLEKPFTPKSLSDKVRDTLGPTADALPH